MARKIDKDNEEKKRRLICISEDTFQLVDNGSTVKGTAVGFRPEVGEEFFGVVDKVVNSNHIMKWEPRTIKPSLVTVDDKGEVNIFNVKYKATWANPGDCVLMYLDGEMFKAYPGAILSGVEVKGISQYSMAGEGVFYDLVVTLDGEDYKLEFDDEYRDLVQEAYLLRLLVDIKVAPCFGVAARAEYIKPHKNADRIIAAQYKLLTGRESSDKKEMLSTLLSFCASEARKLLS